MLVPWYIGTNDRRQEFPRGAGANWRPYREAAAKGAPSVRRLPRSNPWRPPGRNCAPYLRRQVSLQSGLAGSDQRAEEVLRTGTGLQRESSAQRDKTREITQTRGDAMNPQANKAALLGLQWS